MYNVTSMNCQQIALYKGDTKLGMEYFINLYVNYLHRNLEDILKTSHFSSCTFLLTLCS